MSSTSQIGELFGKYAKSGYISEDGFILAVISLIGHPPMQDFLLQLGFQDKEGLTYREFSDAMKELLHTVTNEPPSPEDLVSVLQTVFSKDTLTLSEFVSAFQHNATVLSLGDVSEELLVGLYQYAGGLDKISLAQFTDFIHLHAGRY
ncbi:Hypothetical protein GLP15_775 [Giardia lamblia P15]|uniref:EF-hand domain-containing protein n=1 Tax=Giardia intestinalis (strain P15) TaxID=658858 RepID=E1EXX8_GIAIA|nr:Hypothetical protein GLP15_775 [Giardia lamblia P15]